MQHLAVVHIVTSNINTTNSYCVRNNNNNNYELKRALERHDRYATAAEAIAASVAVAVAVQPWP